MYLLYCFSLFYSISRAIICTYPLLHSFSFSLPSLYQRETCFHIYSNLYVNLLPLFWLIINCICFTSINECVSALSFAKLWISSTLHILTFCRRMHSLMHFSTVIAYALCDIVMFSLITFLFAIFFCSIWFGFSCLLCARGLFRMRPRRGKCHPWRPPSAHPGSRILGPL